MIIWLSVSYTSWEIDVSVTGGSSLETCKGSNKKLLKTVSFIIMDNAFFLAGIKC